MYYNLEKNILNHVKNQDQYNINIINIHNLCIIVVLIFSICIN